MIIYWCMTVNGGNEMKALLLKTSVWLVLLFSAMGLWHVSNATEQRYTNESTCSNNDRQSNNR